MRFFFTPVCAFVWPNENRVFVFSCCCVLYSLVHYSVKCYVWVVTWKLQLNMFQPYCSIEMNRQTLFFECVFTIYVPWFDSFELKWKIYVAQNTKKKINGVFLYLVNACFHINAFNPPIGLVWHKSHTLYAVCTSQKLNNHLKKEPKIYDEKQQQPTFEWTQKTTTPPPTTKIRKKYGKFNNETSNKPDQLYNIVSACILHSLPLYGSF